MATDSDRRCHFAALTGEALSKVTFRKRRLTGQSLRILGCSDAAELVKNFGEAASDTSEESSIGVVWQRAAKHLQNVLGGIDRK